MWTLFSPDILQAGAVNGLRSTVTICKSKGYIHSFPSSSLNDRRLPQLWLKLKHICADFRLEKMAEGLETRSSSPNRMCSGTGRAVEGYRVTVREIDNVLSNYRLETSVHVCRWITFFPLTSVLCAPCPLASFWILHPTAPAQLILPASGVSLLLFPCCCE